MTDQKPEDRKTFFLWIVPWMYGVEVSWNANRKISAFDFISTAIVTGLIICSFIDILGGRR